MPGLLDVALVAACALPLVTVALDRVSARRRRRRAREELTRVPETPIEIVKDGEKVRIKGRAVAREPLRTSPVSRRRCIGYRPTVDYRDRAGIDSFLESASPALASLLAKGGVTAADVFVPDRVFRYVETVVMPGAVLMAVGRARIEIDQGGRAPSHREPPVVCYLGGPDERVVIADAD